MGHGPGMGMGGMMRGRGMGPGMMGNSLRLRYAMMGPGLPAAYANLRNPLPATAQNIAAGKRLYEENCASCHGARGRGNGEAGKGLNPPPANLTLTVRNHMVSDGYLMWAISEGGEKLNTAMPAFRDVLNERQRWQLILYLRHGLR
jgi:mono/diheme cytochrome c family protein